jgi:hypothetical protein
MFSTVGSSKEDRSHQIILKWKERICWVKGMLISTTENRGLRSMVDRAYQTPLRFLPLTMGGGLSWWYFPCGTLIHVTFLLTRTPSLITTYRLNPPLSKPPNHSYIPPPCSDVTLHYPLHVTLHIPLHCLHVSLHHLNKDMWQTMSARTRVIQSERSLWVYSQPLIIVQWKDSVSLRS